ncbi:hypothetical protein [Halosimplex amylolyticum]|uniref:hypothetical protein n=1 Tax=Halosimplex amylolyticum TaxID=3396616 RepID=UPI003F5731E3
MGDREIHSWIASSTIEESNLNEREVGKQMSGNPNLKGTKCFDSCGSDGNIDLISCVDGTSEKCTLGKRETGSQSVEIKNAKRHTVDTEVILNSQNDAIEFHSKSGSSAPEHDEDITVGPASIGSAGANSFKIDIKQSTQTLVSEETLEVSLDYEYQNSSRGTITGPDVFPRINLK